MMSANGQLNHTPPTTWTCYTSSGGTASGQSNLCSNFNYPSDPSCIAQYVDDQGGSNTEVGHRRWIFYPQTQISGTGDIPQNGAFNRTNALKAWDSNFGGTRPPTRASFVAWPYAGFFPRQLLPGSGYWSFSYPGADFSSASVTMNVGSTAVTASLEPVANGYGENTLVWSPNALSIPAADTAVTVHVNNVMINSAPQSFTYTVTVFDATTPSLTVTPTATFRDSSGAIWLSKQGSTSLHPAGGVFSSDPATAQSPASDTFTIARDASNSIWINTFGSAASSWSGWVHAGAVAQGVPAIAVTTGGTAYFAIRDSFNAYWLNSYAPGTGLGTWTFLGGVFASDPAMASALDGSLYLIGKDNSDSIWSGRYVPGSGFGSWQPGGGVAQGKPSVNVGLDGAAYVTIRDSSNGVWMGRVQGNAWSGWFFAEGSQIRILRMPASAIGAIPCSVIPAERCGTAHFWKGTLTAGKGRGHWREASYNRLPPRRPAQGSMLRRPLQPTRFGGIRPLHLPGAGWAELRRARWPPVQDNFLERVFSISGDYFFRRTVLDDFPAR